MTILNYLLLIIQSSLRQKKLSPGFLNKCPIFSLSDLDESIKDIELILSGMIKNGKGYIQKVIKMKIMKKKMK